MKITHLFVPLLLAITTHNIDAQTYKKDYVSTSPDSNTNQVKSAKLNQKKINADLYHQHKFLNNCAGLTRADYTIPADYTSTFVQITEWQSYRGTRSGIIMTDSGSAIRITTENSKIPENNITALALDQDDQLWIGTNSSGIAIGTGNDVMPFRTHPVQTRDQHIRSIAVDEAGLVWVVYKNGGIECFLDGISCSYFPNE